VKILHTSDWHVGRSLHRVPRIDEMRTLLDEVVGVATAENVDAVLVCGDVFEHLSPSAEAEQLVYDALLRLGEEERAVVLIAGNHDHPGRWRALAPLFRRFNIHVVDDLRPPDEGGILRITARDGRERLEVAAVPWVSERRLFNATELMEGGERPYTAYADGMANSIHQLCAGFSPGACHVLAAHLFISGSIPSGTERPLLISDIYAVNPTAIPATVQYAALGHVHRPQEPPGVPNIPCRYSGSLLRIDFGEVGQEKIVNVVDAQPDRPARIRPVRLNSARALRDIHAGLDDLEQHRIEGDDAYLRVFLTCDAPQPGLNDRVREILPNALQVSLVYPEAQETETADVRSKSPRELFSSYLQGRYGSPPDPALVDLFESMLAEPREGAGQQLLWPAMAADPSAVEALEVSEQVAAG